MQCEIRAIGDIKDGARSSKATDTLPKQGRVNEVCKEWLVHEDGALAYKLQKEEVEQHYTGNKCRNAIVREDFPRAKSEQARELRQALEEYQEQEERDAAVARRLAERIEQDEEVERHRREQDDQLVARRMQEKERLRKSVNQRPWPVGDVNSVGLPLATGELQQTPPSRARDVEQRLRYMRLNGSVSPPPPPLPHPISNSTEEPIWPPPPPDELITDDNHYDEQIRRLQEQKDEELARLLQEQEEELDSNEMLDRDRLIAIEAQDKELARLLQEKERAKARRARERAKQKAMARKQQQALELDGLMRDNGAMGGAVRPTSLDLSSAAIRYKHRYSEPDKIEEMSSACNPVTNIAMAIDPTYTPTRLATLNVTSPTAHSMSPPELGEEDFEGPAPPYMPIQGQRRTASLEKKQKKKVPKDGCKQQ